MQSPDEAETGAQMTPREAQDTLSTIRTLMERGTVYKNISSASAIAAGLVTLAGCAVRAAGILPFDDKWSFFTVWGSVFAVAVAAIVGFTAAEANRNGEPLWSRSARTVVFSILPAFLAAVVLSHVLFQRDLRDLLPGTWMLLYGCGALAMSFFTPLSIRILGIAFMAAGTIALCFLPGHDVLAMGVSFGGIHLAWGMALWVQRQQFAARQAPDGLAVQDR